MDAGKLISHLGKTYVVTRNAGSYANGAFVPGTATVLSIVASVQPITGKELVRIEEGERNRERLRLYTTTQLRVADEAGVMADVVSVDSRNFQVESVESWLGTFYKCVLVSVGG